jgi:hypothetical protein
MFLELVVLVSAEDLTKEGIIGRRKKWEKGAINKLCLVQDVPFLSYTVFNICDVFGTGCTCIWRGFDKRKEGIIGKSKKREH